MGQAKTGVNTSANYSDNNNVAYIVDGMLKAKPSIDQNNIFSEYVVSGKQLEGLYSNKKLDTVTVIVTRLAAIKTYQDKLSSFSREYEDYLKNHGNNDDDIQYIVHNDPLEKPEVLHFLYNLPSEKIISVTFADNADKNQFDSKKIITIDLKVGE